MGYIFITANSLVPGTFNTYINEHPNQISLGVYPLGITDLVANFYMEYLKQEASASAPVKCKPKLQKRYVDDTLEIITKRMEEWPEGPTLHKSGFPCQNTKNKERGLFWAEEARTPRRRKKICFQKNLLVL